MAIHLWIWFSSNRGPCLRANKNLSVSIPGQCSSEKPLDPCVAEYSVTEQTRREASGSKCKLLLWNMVKTQAGSNNSKQVWHRQDRRTILNGLESDDRKGNLEGWTRGVICKREQRSRRVAIAVRNHKQSVYPKYVGENRELGNQETQQD